MEQKQRSMTDGQSGQSAKGLYLLIACHRLADERHIICQTCSWGPSRRSVTTANDPEASTNVTESTDKEQGMSTSLSSCREPVTANGHVTVGGGGG